MNESEFASKFPQTLAVIQKGIDQGFHTGCQIYISLNETILADAGIGQSKPGMPMNSDTINLWLSSGKPLTAVAILQQRDQGRLEVDDRVARFIPEFEQNGKQEITIRHVLTHTSGFRHVETGWPDVSWDESIRRICESPLEEGWVVGQTAGYHTTSSWFILGEILQRLTGQPFADVIRDNIFRPLGMTDSRAAIPIDQFNSAESRIGWLYQREAGELKLLDWHEPSRCAAASPGGNIRGPIRDLGRFYEMLLNHGVGREGRVLSIESVQLMTSRHRSGSFDQTLGAVVDFGLGIIIDSKIHGLEIIPYGYSRYSSGRTFGHGGAQSSQGWCDPESGLVVAYFFNGRAGEGQHQRRAKNLNDAIVQDLGSAGLTGMAR
ncbi:MAG: beta-lactamase family protein [Planctomycetes bacterium]|nr:beta-lactamase family protein [Planctomycetota bacterium]